MSKTLTPSAKTVTVRDPKGRKFLDLVGAPYNKALLTEPEAQRVNEAGGLGDLIDGYIAQHRYEVPIILKLVADNIKLPAHERFVAKDAFVHGQGFYLWDAFQNTFLGKVEENVSAATLAVHRLQKYLLDAQIRKELGQKHEEISLAHLFDLLKKQSKGERGPLFVDGYVNIAYIRDMNGKLCAVRNDWSSDWCVWRVDALSVEGPNGWGSGFQVVSRDC